MRPRKLPLALMRTRTVLPEGRTPRGGLLDGQLAGSSHWLLVVGLCALVAIICAIDRTAMSVAVLPMGQQYGWSDTTRGAVSRRGL
jgi:hypothetical protein